MVRGSGRLAGLGRAHDLVRPLPGRDGKASLFGDLIAILLAPYDNKGAFSGRVRVAVPRMGVGIKSATTIALVLHSWLLTPSSTVRFRVIPGRSIFRVHLRKTNWF